MANMYYTSTGERISQATIDRRYSQSIKKKYEGMPSPHCYGCGSPHVNGSAHTIAKARLKTLHKSELVYDPDAYWPACQRCNTAIENPKGSDWKKLMNIDQCLKFIKKHDSELYRKFTIQ